MAVRFGEIPFQVGDGRWYWNWTDPDGIAWPKGPFETKDLALEDIGKSKARITETTMTIPPPGWNNADDLDRMLAEAKDFTPWPPSAPDAAKVDQLIDLALGGAHPGDATYTAVLNAGVDAEHDYTTGLIELSLAELQAFRAILALRRRT
jgi:hypothetical protein